MPRRCRRTCLALVLVSSILFVTIQLWNIDDQTNGSNKIDASHVKLLRDYQSKRIKNCNRVLVVTGQRPSETPLRTRQWYSSSAPDTKILTNSSKISKEPTKTSIDDLFIAVKSTGKFHKTRLPLLLDTWIPLARQSVSMTLC